MRYRYLLSCINAVESLSEDSDVAKKYVKYDIQAPTFTLEETILGPEQASDLNEFLVAHAYKWREIGTALKFKPQDLSTIQASPFLLYDSPRSYLSRLLEEWLLKKFEHTLPPTVYNLKKALRSRTVGLGALANELDTEKVTSDSFMQAMLSYSIVTVSANVVISPDEKRSLTYSSSSMTNYIKLEEGKSTLIEVQVSSPKRYVTEYQWCENSMDIGKKRKTYSGSTSPILCITADLFLDDNQISCDLTFHPELNHMPLGLFSTTPIKVNISCPLDKYKSSLASMYLAQPEVPEDTWPPVGNKKFINLALIKQEVINYGSEYARLTVRGDIDDVLQNKQKIEYSEVFTSLHSGQLLVIEGRPGSGKTTFVNKMTRDWAVTSGGGIRLTLLVSLRVLNTINRPDLSDILSLFQDLKVDKELIEERDGNGVCFIFDGLDEFLPPEGENSIVNKIINKTYLNKSTVIVASRPAAVVKLRHRADKVIEVLGFLKEQILEYFDSYPFSSSTKPAELKAYLSLHPNILHMCYLPIHASMVAFLFEVTGQVPKTETNISLVSL